MYNQKYKKLFWTIKDGPVTGKTGSPVSSFLSYSIFWLIPIWGLEASRVYLFARASKTHVRGSPRRGTLWHPLVFKRAPVASVGGAIFLS